VKPLSVDVVVLAICATLAENEKVDTEPFPLFISLPELHIMSPVIVIELVVRLFASNKLFFEMNAVLL
jgi:hypothetical protein